MSATRQALRAVGLRCTPARERVLAAIEAAARPLTHGALHEDPALADLDAITLYRTLTTLGEADLVHRVPGPDGAWRYCAQPRGRGGCPGNHAHFVCAACGAMSCLLEQPMPRVDVPDGAVVEGRWFLVHGRCRRCAA